MSRTTLDHQLEETGRAPPMAKAFIANVLRSRAGASSLHDVFDNHVTFQKVRNRRKVLALARGVDALLDGRISDAIELLVRRLAGVHTADYSDSWDACDRFEQVMESRSFVPSRFLASTIKSINQDAALHRAGKDDAKPRTYAAKKPATSGGTTGGTSNNYRAPHTGLTAAAGSSGAVNPASTGTGAPRSQNENARNGAGRR